MCYTAISYSITAFHTALHAFAIHAFLIPVKPINYTAYIWAA